MRPEPDHAVFFSMDIATGAEKVIGSTDKDKTPLSNLNPSIRLSLSPDGKSFTYGTVTLKDNLWMLDGFAARRGLLARLGFR